MTTVQANVEQAKKEVIVPTKSKAGWLDARELVRTQGGLPTNALHDKYLVETNDYKSINSLYPAWAREVLVYPEKNGMFKKGQDVKDAFTDDKGREWILPASCIPEQVVGVKAVGLFVDPESVEVNDKRVAIISKPEAIIVLTPFMQENGWGRMDGETRVPLALPEDSEDRNNRYLWRIDGVGVRPLVRLWFVDWGVRRYVGAVDGHGDGFGVAGTSLAVAEPKLEIAQVPENSGLLVSGVTLKEFKAMLKYARTEVEEVADFVKDGKLDRTQQLLRTLEIKD